MKLFRLYLISMGVLYLTSGGAIAEDAEGGKSASRAADLILLSLTLDPNTGESQMDGGEVVSELAKLGVIDPKTEARFDYSSYYLPIKKVSLFGARLVYFEHEFFKEWVGCCVSPGNAIALTGGDDIGSVETFAKKNRCRLERGREAYIPEKLMNSLGLSEEQKSELIVLSCKHRDRS